MTAATGSFPLHGSDRPWQGLQPPHPSDGQHSRGLVLSFAAELRCVTFRDNPSVNVMGMMGEL